MFIFWHVIIVHLQSFFEIKFVHASHSVITSLNIFFFTGLEYIYIVKINNQMQKWNKKRQNKNKS